MSHRNLRAIVAALAAQTSLAHAAETLAPTVVVATRLPSRVSEVLGDVTVIERTDIERAGQSSLVELLGAEPGIQVTQNGGRGATSSLMIRGANPNQTLVLIDGLRVSSSTTGTTALEHLPLDAIERIEILRGPASALYGADAIGGVIRIVTREGAGVPMPRFFVGAGRYRTGIAAAGYGGDIDGTRFNVQVGIEDSHGFSAIKEAKRGTYDMFNPDADGYDNRNVNARIARRFGRDLELSAAALRAEANRHYDATNCDTFGSTCTVNYDNRLKQTLTAYSVEAGYRVNPNWKTLLRLGRSEDGSRNWSLDPGFAIESQSLFEKRQNQATWQNDFNAGELGRFMAALEWRGEKVVSTQTYTESDRATRSLVFGYQGKLDRHSVQAGARVDDVDRLGSHRTGSFAYGYRLADAWTARASVGTSFHLPTFNDLYWPLDFANFFQGNPALKPERGRNREIGLQYDAGKTRAGIALYRNRVSDLINYQAGAAPTYIGTYANLSQATLKGATLHYERRAGAWIWKAGYDVLSARDDVSGRFLQRRAPHTGTLEARHHGERCDAGIQVVATDARFNDNNNRQTLGGYGVVNLDIAWPLQKDLVVTAKLNNVFDKDYTLVRSTLNPYNDYAVAGRNLFVGLRYAPRK